MTDEVRRLTNLNGRNAILLSARAPVFLRRAFAVSFALLGLKLALAHA